MLENKNVYAILEKNKLSVSNGVENTLSEADCTKKKPITFL